MAEGKIFLELKNQLSELDRLHRTLAEFGQRHRLPAKLLFSMSLALKPVGGLGIYLVRTLMDDIVYQRQENRNVLVIKKKVQESEER